MTPDPALRAASRDPAPDALFARYRDHGDAAALGALFDRTGAELFRIAQSMTRDAASAEDAVQETYLAAIEFAGRWDGSRPVVPWLVGILRHKVEALRRDGARRPDDARLVRRLPPLDPAGIAALRDDADRLRAAMDALPEPYRQAALLRWRHGLEPSEIAHLTGERPVAIRVRLHRALARLRERVQGGAALSLLVWSHGEIRGLDTVRATVLSRARAGRIAASAAGVAGGLLVAKKLVAAAVVVLLAVGGTLAVRSALDDAGSRTPVVPAPVHPDAVPLVGRAAPPAEDVPAAARPEPPRRTGGAPFTGIVYLPDGRPATGAVVTATALRPWSERGSATAPASDVVRVAKDGTFDARLPDGTAVADLIVSAPGCASAVFERTRSGVPAEVRLVREGVLIGHVTDAVGNPIGGATARVVRVLAHENVEVVTATADAAGEFRIGGFSGAERRTYLYVLAPGFGAVRTWEPFPGAGGMVRQDLVLYPSRPLTVHVVDAESGSPLDGATVTIGYDATGLQIQRDGEPGEVLPHPAPYIAEGRTDARGVCVLADAPGRWPALDQIVVRAWRTGHVFEAAITRARPGTAEEPTVLKLWPAATVTGRVVDTDGAPVARADVSAEPSWSGWAPAPIGDFPWRGTASTDAEGRYTLGCVRASAGATEVVRVGTWGSLVPDAAGRVYGIGNRAQAELRLRPGETTTAPDLVVAAPVAPLVARFVVVGPDGAPVADAALNSPGSRTLEARTDAAGRASLEWASKPGAGYIPPKDAQVEIRAAGFARTVVHCAPTAVAPAEIRVTIEPPRTLRGRVTVKDGGPVAGADISAVPGDDWLLLARTQTASDGTFELAGLPSRPFLVSASVGDRWMKDFRRAEAKDVVPGGADVELVLPPDSLRRGRVAALVFAEETGEPLVEAGFEVQTDPWIPRIQQQAGAPGVFELSGVPVGTWKTYAWARGRLSAQPPVVVTDGETTRVRIALRRGTAVHVQVKVPEELTAVVRELTALRIDTAPGEDGAGASYRADIADGVARFEALPPGRFRFAWSSMSGWGIAAQHATAAATFDVLPPSDTPQRGTAELVRCGSVTVKSDDANLPGQQTGYLSNAAGFVELVDPRGARSAVVVGLNRGRWTHEMPLLAGTYTVRLLLPGGGVRTTEAVVRAGEKTEVVVPAE